MWKEVCAVGHKVLYFGAWLVDNECMTNMLNDPMLLLSIIPIATLACAYRRFYR